MAEYKVVYVGTLAHLAESPIRGRIELGGEECYVAKTYKCPVKPIYTESFNNIGNTLLATLHKFGKLF